MRKAVFFDIDGTIWNRQNEIPDSTVKAIRKLRKKGHLAFLCSGRTRAFIRSPKLLDIGFDGIISGCATMVEWQGKTIFYHQIDPAEAARDIALVRRYGFRPILEGKDYLYMDEAEFGHEAYGKKLIQDVGERLRSIQGHWGQWEISKFSCATENSDTASVWEKLGDRYDFMIHNEAVAEVVPKGFHKGTGIQRICDLLGMDLQDTVAIGDSENDRGMFQTAGFSVCMGNGQAKIKEIADFVTTDMEDDGIWNACRHLSLL